MVQVVSTELTLEKVQQAVDAILNTLAFPTEAPRSLE
jgi:hypothetical protein